MDKDNKSYLFKTGTTLAEVYMLTYTLIEHPVTLFKYYQGHATINLIKIWHIHDKIKIIKRKPLLLQQVTDLYLSKITHNVLVTSAIPHNVSVTSVIPHNASVTSAILHNISVTSAIPHNVSVTSVIPHDVSVTSAITHNVSVTSVITPLHHVQHGAAVTVLSLSSRCNICNILR
jgi:hypothetical protein